MITPLIVPAVLFASPADLPSPNDAAVRVGQLAVATRADTQGSPVVVVPLPPPVVLVDPSADAANQVPARPSTTPLSTPSLPPSSPEDIGADEVGVDKDPLEGFNRVMFGIHLAMDKAILRPAAMGYKKVVPKPVRTGARNVLSNLTEPYVFLNFLLQGKPGKAAETFARFMVNSTLGIGGLIDVAKTKDFNLPHRPNGFGTTLALHGVKSGPYLFLPFVGPTTLRDVLGTTADGSVLPLAIGKPFSTWEYQIATGAINGLDMRAEADSELRALFADAVDPYATLRAVYLQNRAAEIDEVRGKHRAKKADAAPELDEPLNDPAGSPTASDTPPDPQPSAAPSTSSDAPELQNPLKDPATN